ncbi:MAG: HAMP domain-containing sensor histidine kinase [Bacteroidota bacterium]
MRLITKTTLWYLLLALMVFGVGGWMTYTQVKKEVKRETDYSLRSNMRMLINAIKEGSPIEALRNSKVEIRAIEAPTKPLEPRGYFSDTLALHPSPKIDALEPFRKLTAVRQINGQHYWISIIDVFIESDDMVQGVWRIMTRLFLLLSLVLLLFSFLISRQLLLPFRQILSAISRFDLRKQETLALPTTNTREFRELNQFVQSMTEKARNDYQLLKEFSENASHEIQTPIAVAQGKLELLQSQPNLQPEQLQLLQEAQSSLNKLSRLGQSLTLLTKIENQEFVEEKAIDFSALLQSNLSIFKELITLKGLRLKEHIDPQVRLPINRNMADLLITNLLKNAIQHNIENGWIRVKFEAQQLEISNSGIAPGLPTEQLFERFRKSQQSSASLGLGLAIVSKICERQNIKLRYLYENQVHMLKLNWN